VADAGDHEEYARVKEPALRKLDQTRIGRQFRQKWFEKHHDLVLLDAASAFKVSRKVPKAIFTWAKSWADVGAGYPEWRKAAREVPGGILAWYARKQAGLFADVHLITDTD
jgi:hypothetical protein